MSNVYVYNWMDIDRYLYISQNYSYLYMSNIFSQIALQGSSSSLCSHQHIYESAWLHSLATHCVIKVFDLFQSVGWKMVSDNHRKTCIRMYIVVLLIIVKTTRISLKRPLKPCNSQKAIFLIVHLREGCGGEWTGKFLSEARARGHRGQWTKRTILRAEPGISRLADQGSHSSANGCLFYSSSGEYSTCDGPVTALCFPFSSFQENVIHLSYSFLITLYWVNSIMWFLTYRSLDLEKAHLGLRSWTWSQ